MQDDHGLYYYPNPADTRSRVYVRQGEDGLEFRLWHADHDMVWEKHGWVPQAALEEAAELYRAQGKANPMSLYDTVVGQALINDALRKKERQ
ncbi:MAG: hypothetical protein DELT_01620 [Desulfovibrio sp.]